MTWVTVGDDVLPDSSAHIMPNREKQPRKKMLTEEKARASDENETSKSVTQDGTWLSLHADGSMRQV
jgi:hypothetical protein